MRRLRIGLEAIMLGVGVEYPAPARWLIRWATVTEVMWCKGTTTKGD